MSLGIYDAFIFDQSYTMEELTKMVDILRKDVKKPIDIQLHKYVLEKFLYCYYLRGNLSIDEILEMAKKELEQYRSTRRDFRRRLGKKISSLGKGNRTRLYTS